MIRLQSNGIAFLTQLAEYSHGKRKVAGSNPARGKIHASRLCTSACLHVESSMAAFIN